MLYEKYVFRGNQMFLRYLETRFFPPNLGKNTRFGEFGEKIEEAKKWSCSQVKDKDHMMFGMVVGVKSYMRVVWKIGSGPADIIYPSYLISFLINIFFLSPG